MVRRVVQLVYQEIRGLHQAAYVLAGFAFGSQILAVVRDRILAAEFGAGADLDMYYSAFRIPDLLFVLFSSVLSVYVLVPFVTKHVAEKQSLAARDFFSQIFSLFLISYVFLATALFFLMPVILPKLFPGIADTDTLITISRILLLQPFFLGLSSLFGVVTQMGHRFVLYALSPIVYNIGIIIGVVALYPVFALDGLVLGVALGAIGHALIQLPFVRKEGWLPRITLRYNWNELRRVVTLALPRMLALSTNQLVIFVLVVLAGGMAVGSVSVFQFAFNLQSVPLAIIGVSYSVAAFPTLSRFYQAGEMTAFVVHIKTALRHIIFWSIPVIFLLIVLRAQLVRVLLGTGQFDWSDTRLTAAAFAILLFSLLGQGVNLLLMRAFYASGRSLLPFISALFGGVVGVSTAVYLSFVYDTYYEISFFLAELFRVSDVAGTEVLMLVCGYAIGVLVQATVLLIALQITFNCSLRALTYNMLQACFASMCGAFTAYATLHFLVDGLQTDTFVGIALQGSVAGIAGVVAVVFGYSVVGSTELKEVRSALERRLFKTNVTAPEKELL